jgi:perosamine synthetase
LPVLSGLRDVGAGRVRGILDAGTALWLSSGSAAIALALRSAPVSAGDEVLVPAFNCPTMVTPIRFVGAAPVFYQITERLDLVAEDIARKVTAKTRALIAPHLFGRIQDLRPLRRLCDERGMVLIEDCAHLFFAEAAGSIGHYAIASPKKFFPLAEGGLLVSRERAVDLRTVAPSSAKQALRHAFDTVDLAAQSGRLPWAAWLINGAKRVKGGSPPAVASTTWQDAPPVIQRASAATRCFAASYSHERSVRRRRENYARIREGLRSISHLRLLDVQDSRAAPYMVPVLLENPPIQFAELKSQGLPMWRWEDSIRGVCTVTDRYAEALIQLPCHQSVTSAECDRMLEILGRYR